MAFRASNQVKADGYAEANVAIQLHERLIADRARFLAIRDLPGMAAYAADQEQDAPGYAVGTEFNAMVTAIEGVRDWIISNVNTASWVTFSTSGVATKTFTSGQTAGLRTQLTALIATIS
jgi:hypothetical protein